MDKNYPRFFNFFKPGLFLVVFLFFSFNGFGQTISKPIISDVPVCKGSNLILTFTVKNADNGASNKYFTADTKYLVYDYTGGASLLRGEYNSNVQPNGRNASATIVLSIFIPNNASYPAATDYRIKVFSENPDAESNFSDPFTVKSKPLSPSVTNNSPICEGETLELTTSNIAGATYSWSGPNGYTATGQTLSRTNVTTAMAGTYTVTAMVNGCSSDPVSTNVTINNTPTLYSENEIGNDSWIGHVYDGTNLNQNFNQDFTNYIGGYEEPLSFDQNFGGNQNNFQLGSGICAPSIYTETFAVRYRMNSTLNGLYAINIGSDDGTRLSVDDDLIYDDWNDHAYRNQDILVNLSGNSNLVLDYYENAGGNRVSVTTPKLLIENILTSNTSQTISTPSDFQEISGDDFANLPNGISRENTGFQWVYSNTQGGAISLINGANGTSFNPDTSIVPFDSPGTYYVYRIASLNGNNIGQNYNTSIKSNPATIIVEDFCADLDANNNISFFKGNTATLQATVNENQDINFSAPEGTVFTYIDFASYGTPTTNNGSFTIDPNCHAATSQSITESYLLGESAATVPATNVVFTDPCVGAFKRLYVSATYAEAVCEAEDPGTITGTNINGNNIEYQWQISTTGAAGSFSPAPGNNISQNYQPGTLYEDIWLKRQVTTDNCTSESAVLYIPVKKVNTWTGAADTNWNNTNNWSCNSLPTLETNVLIPENLTSGNYPEINPGTNAFAKDLVIENTASVLVNDNWLRIAGNLTNNGVLNTFTGSISFEGTSAQIIPNSAFENNRIRNLNIDNSSGVTSEAIIEVTGTLKVENGNFDTGNELTLISDENQTALIDGSGNGEVIGLVTMQRYLDRAFGYKYFSAPFQNSIVGDFEPFMNFTDPVTAFPHFYRYDENRNIAINDTVRDATGWTAYIDPANNLNIGEGYALNFGTTTAAQTIELIGEVNNGTIPARQLENNHREYTKGFHLVGNPYPSPIDWDADLGWTKTNIDDGIYFFTAGNDSQYTGTYTAYVNNISTTDPREDGRSSNIIPSMQGFFIKVSDSDIEDKVTGSFGMDNNVRVTDFDQEFLRTQEDLKPLIRLEAGFNTSNRQDLMVIYFSSYATPNFEKEMDAHKLMNTDPAVPSFYNLTEDKKELAINAIPFPESRSYKKIPLGIKADQNGKMKINLTAVENLNSNFNIYLIDHKKGKGQNLRNNPEYSFNIQAGTHNSRFELMFSEEKVTSPAIAFNEPFDVDVENGDLVVKLNLEENQEGILRASTMTGQILQIKEASGKDQVIFEGITSEGVYIINLQVGKDYYGKKVLIKK
ncbi:hypothetical protein LB465_03760 [Salegentibacter sp. LM13S]|uniref:hypothetical protein n=1 Tax=Salegentibacter lacus TaxID=2873599 RepID=UPI001CCBC59C|nr:hypothetical protein [Salegentibacter lacus]MBZ9629885.1 hypothetical protein [Salegentibacter lacus]